MGWLRRIFRRPPLLHVAIDEGSGPLVVLVHGIASSSATFDNLVPLLTPSRRVVAIDLLGFGRSPGPSDAEYTLEEHVAALARTIQRVAGRDPFTLVGHSLGSLVATRYAAQHGSRIARLVLVSPPIYLRPGALSSPLERATMGLYLRAYEYLRDHKQFTMRAAARLAAIAPIDNVLEVSERNWRAFTLSLSNAIEQQTTIDDLAAVDAPIELAYGTLDPFLVPSGLRIAERLRNVTVHRVDGGDHLIRPRLARVTAAAVLSDAERTSAARDRRAETAAAAPDAGGDAADPGA